MMPIPIPSAASASSPTPCPQNYKFTGKERDAESGLDDFVARFCSSALGRYSSPDPLVMSRQITDPQSLNKYSYAFNRPTVLVDPDGEWPGWYHHVIIQDTFGNLGAHAVSVLEAASDWVDSVTAGNQAPNRAFMPAMSDGTINESGWSSRTAHKQLHQFRTPERSRCATCIRGPRGGKGDSDDALTHFGHALHTVTDRTSPEHTGYQPWYCLVSRSWRGGVALFPFV